MCKNVYINMEKIIIGLIFLISLNSFSQSRSFSDCKTAELEAEKLAKKEIFIVQNYGLNEDRFSDFNLFYEVYVFSKYGVVFEENGSCFVSDTNFCFGIKTLALLNDKYGKNFLKKNRKKLSTEFDGLTLEEKQSIINPDIVYDTYTIALDCGVKYIGNDLRLKKLFERKLNENKVFIEDSELELIINTDGKIIGSNYLNKDKKLIPLDKKIVTEFLAMNTNFVPAYLFDKKVKSTYVIFF